MKTVLLHVCCAPCSTYCIEELRRNKLEPILYFYNPNIHPKEEHDKRLSEVKIYAKEAGCELIIGDYDVKIWHEWVKGLESEPEGGKRCAKCFEMRLQRTAGNKKDFTTSLTVSPHKNSKVIMALAKELAEKEGIGFIDFDFKKKDGYRKSIELSKANNIYRQDYCGCIYSLAKIKSPKSHCNLLFHI